MSAAITCFPAFMDIDETEQALEVEEFLAEKSGTSFPSEPSDGDDVLLKRLGRIVEQCHVIFEGNSEPESEGLFYAVLSLLHLVPADKVQEVLDTFCKQLTKSANKENGHIIVRLFSLILVHLPVDDRRGLSIFLSQISLASSLGLAAHLKVTQELVTSRVKNWKLSDSEKKELYLLLWKALNQTNTRLANACLTTALHLCPASEAEQLAEHASNLLLALIQDDSTFVMDQLLQLEPVKMLKGKSVYQLLEIFVSGNYSDYMKFWEQNQTFCISSELSHVSCQHKMRLLTMMSLSNTTNELPFDLLQQQLELELGEIEAFIIDAVKVGLIQAKINQVARVIVITGGTAKYRTFGLDTWKHMHQRLVGWRSNVNSVYNSLQVLGLQHAV